MQDSLDLFRDAGIRVFALSYDDQEALSAYSEARGIEYTLLSDPDSQVIDAFRLRNTLIQPTDIPFYGIPFPGTFIIDEDGKIVDKFFHRHLANRESVEGIIDRVLGRVEIGEQDPVAAFTEEDGIQVQAFLRGGDGKLKIGPIRRLVVRLTIPEGKHIYAEPVPEGMTATQIRIEAPDGIRIDSPELPPSHSMRQAGTTEPLRVWSAGVDFVYPLFANSQLAKDLQKAKESSVQIGVIVRYQACDDEMCFVPRTARLELEIPVAPGEVPNFEALKGAGNRVVEMETGSLFQKLAARQTAAAEEGARAGSRAGAKASPRTDS